MKNFKLTGTEKEIAIAQKEIEKFIPQAEKLIEAGKNGRSIDFVGVYNALINHEGEIAAHKVINLLNLRLSKMTKEMKGLSFEDQIK